MKTFCLNGNGIYGKLGKHMQKALIALLVMAFAVFPSNTLASNGNGNGNGNGGDNGNAPSYSITISASANGASVNVDGNVTVSNGAGSGADSYDVQVFWDSTGNTSDTTNTSTHLFSPASGEKTFSGTWSNSHTYTTSGTYTIQAKLYHGNLNGNDGDSSQTAVVVITVPASTGSLTVTKVVSGGSLEVGSFNLFVDGIAVVSGSATTTSVGTHVVTETAVAGYTGAFSGDCDSSGNVTVSSTSSKNCILTNTYTATSTGTSTATTTSSATSTLTVIKTVINDNGGTSTASNFVLTLTNGTSTTNFEGSTNGTVFILNASTTYSVTEASSSSYAASYSEGCSGTIGSGEIRFCTVTNNDISATSTATSTATTTATSTESGGGNNGGNTGGGTGGGSNVIAPATGGGGSIVPVTSGQVLGASTDFPSSCSAFIGTYLRRGAFNNIMDMARLQLFLNSNLGIRIPVNGVFDNATENAVRQFQVKYGQEILGPWVSAGLHPNIYTSTGYVYKTTARWINMLNCPSLNIPVPQLP